MAVTTKVPDTKRSIDMVSKEERQKSRECVMRLKEGDRQAFDELVRLYRKRAFALVFHLVGNVEDAKDIVQEAFIRVYTGISKFRSDADFYTWFYRILKNLTYDHFRRNKKRAKNFSLNSSTNAQGEEYRQEVCDEKLSPQRFVLSGELGRHLDEAVATLPGYQKMAFSMKYLEGMKTEEISDVLGCRSSTVKVHLFRAVNALREKLGPYLKQ